MMNKNTDKKKYEYEIKETRYWLALLNVAEPSALIKEIDKLIELKNTLGSMTPKS
jgi:hypothetical protein